MEAVDSGFELVVLEGGGQGARRYLNRSHLTLGRLDPDDEPLSNVLAFPEPTVSRVHAVLEWDTRKYRYVLRHRSRTNLTLVNGESITDSHVLQPGDRIQMGQLVMELRKVDRREAMPDAENPPQPVETVVYLVVVRGRGRGEICPLNYSRMEMHTPLGPSHTRPGVYVEGLADYHLTLHQRDGRLFIDCPDGPRPTVFSSVAGVVCERRIGRHERFELRREQLLVVGDVAFVLVGVDRAGSLSEALKAEDAPLAGIHPLLESVRFGAEPMWGGTEEHIIRLLAGSARGSTLWIRPADLDGPVVLAPEGTEPLPHLEILDRNAPTVSIRFEEKGVVACNDDERNSFNHNWDSVRPGREVTLVSGDRLTLGRRMVSYEHVPSQALIEAHALRHGERELPLIRAINRLGYTPENELRIDDRRLGASHGRIVLRDLKFFYLHEHAAAEVQVGDRTVAAGGELEIHEGDHLVLAEGVEADFGRRASSVRPSDPVLIGPTQEQIERERREREQAEAAKTAAGSEGVESTGAEGFAEPPRGAVSSERSVESATSHEAAEPAPAPVDHGPEG